MQMLARLVEHDPICVVATPHRIVQFDDLESRLSATRRWEEMTEAGGDGMVIKSRDWLAHGKHGLVQPAMKCRGLEYLRIIYGPEYAAPKNLERLRPRGLKRQRSLALRECAPRLRSPSGSCWVSKAPPPERADEPPKNSVFFDPHDLEVELSGD